MNKIAKTALITGTALCVAGVVLSTVGYFTGGKDFSYTSKHFYVSGGNSSEKDLDIMKKQQIDDFSDLNVDFQDFDLDIRTSEDDHYYMEYRLEKIGGESPLTWGNKDGELTMKESNGSTGGYFINYDLGFLKGEMEETEKQDILNTVILYVPEKAELSNAKLTFSNGDLTIEKLLCKNMTVKLDDGDLFAGELQADELQLKNSDGDVTLKKAALADGKITLGDGDLEIDKSSFDGDMKIKNSNGDVSIGTDADSLEKTDIYLETSNGSIDTGRISSGNSNSDDDTAVYENKVNNADASLEVSSSDGDITLTE